MAIATCVIGLGGIGAFAFAALAWRNQRRELEIARQDSKRLRTPVLHAELASIGSGVPKFRLDVRLSSAEPLARLRVTIAEARGNDCPVGFTAGQSGVDSHPEQDKLPPGWRNDTLRHSAAWEELLPPGTSATWQMAYREQSNGHRPADSAKIQFRAECTAVSGGEPWHVPIPVTVTQEAAQTLRQASGPDLMNTIG
jgi:hypothetical protein